MTVTFTDVEDILGMRLPPSSRTHEPHWYGYEGTAVGRAIRDAGWTASKVSLAEERVTFLPHTSGSDTDDQRPLQG